MEESPPQVASQVCEFCQGRRNAVFVPEALGSSSAEDDNPWSLGPVLRVRKTSRSQVIASDGLHFPDTKWSPWRAPSRDIPSARNIHFQNRLSAGDTGQLSLFLVLLWQEPQKESKLTFLCL